MNPAITTHHLRERWPTLTAARIAVQRFPTYQGPAARHCCGHDRLLVRGRMSRINQRLADWMLRWLDRLDQLGLGMPGFMTFAEDLSCNHGPMLSEKALNAFRLPNCRQVVPELKRRGIRVLIDNDQQTPLGVSYAQCQTYVRVFRECAASAVA